MTDLIFISNKWKEIGWDLLSSLRERKNTNEVYYVALETNDWKSAMGMCSWTTYGESMLLAESSTLC